MLQCPVHIGLYSLCPLRQKKTWYLPLHVTIEYFAFSDVDSIPGHCQLQFIQIFLSLLTLTFTGWKKVGNANKVSTLGLCLI